MSNSQDKQLKSGDDLLESTLRTIKARPKPPAEVEHAVYQHVLEDWKKMRANKKQKRRLVYWSVAASVLMALLISPLVLQLQGVTENEQSLGLVENQRGSISVIKNNKRIQLASGAKSNTLFQGQSLLTAINSGASINWGKGQTVRVDQNTELYLRSSSEIELVTGKIYIDIPTVAGQSQSDKELQILTQFGSINHIGTQFMVSSDADNVEVKVREGTVKIDNYTQVFVTAKGQQTTLNESDQVSHKAISTYGPDWQWVEKLAPAFELEDKPLGDFLIWVSRETGKEILFDTDAAKDIANNTIMHGSVDDEPMLALQLVLQTNDLSWFEKDDKIYLFVSP